MIQISRDRQSAQVWTSDRTMMTKLDHLVENSTMYTCEKVDKGTDGEVISKTYCIADKRMLSFRKNRVKLSEDRRQALVERLARQREFAE